MRCSVNDFIKYSEFFDLPTKSLFYTYFEQSQHISNATVIILYHLLFNVDPTCTTYTLPHCFPSLKFHAKTIKKVTNNFSLASNYQSYNSINIFLILFRLTIWKLNAGIFLYRIRFRNVSVSSF